MKTTRELPAMKAHHLQTVLAGIDARPVTTSAEDEAAFPRLGAFNSGGVYVGRFAGQSPWERHPDADELLHVLEGAVEITVLTEAGPVQTRVGAGSVFIVPRGLWHRQLAQPSVTLLAATPEPSEISFAADPRQTT
jgi:quercetin dioxygenase-like cupin family protein